MIPAGFISAILLTGSQLAYAKQKKDSISTAFSKPNIILILADDMGYSDLGCYGSEIHTPNIDRLANEGIKFLQFYNASVCCPTRASLMSGLYPHEAGVGYMDADLGYESYQGRIKKNVYTLAEILSQNGYSTIMAGKWHLGTRKGDNPWERGFDNFYGIPKGGGVYFWPPLLDRQVVLFDKSNNPAPVTTQPDSASFYSTDAFTGYITGIIDNQKNSNKPFFIYAAYIAPHWPQQAREKDIQKYLGKYSEGWHSLRQKRFKRQQELGIAGANMVLSPGDGLNWDNLTKEQIEKFDRQMAVYAAQVDVLDQNVGKILDALENNNLNENTLVIFLSDNGAQQNDHEGFERSKNAVFGTKQSLGGYAKGWGNLSNTPFRRYKLEQYNGGNATPFIVRWPAVITHTNAISHQVAHVIDIFPTCLAAAGINVENLKPENFQKLQGINLIPHGKNTRYEVKRTLYWEHMGNWAVRQGNWKLVASFQEDAELFNLKEDPAEQVNLIAKNKIKAKKMREDYRKWSEKTGVLPWPVKNEQMNRQDN